MKTRHLVTLAVLLVVGGLAGGIWLRLQGSDGEEGSGDGPLTAEDSVRRELESTAARSAFSTELAVPVVGARVRRDTFVLWVRADGTARAVRRASLRAEVEGEVLAVPSTEGERVEPGELVARLDSTSYRLDVRAKEAEYQKTLAEYENLLVGEEELGLTPEERETRRRQAAVRSGLTQAEVELEKARYELAKTRIRAPFAGRLANLAVTEGSRVDPQDSVAVVLDLSSVEVDVQVLQTRVPHLRVGNRARATFAALPGETFAGRVVSINPLVDRESGTARVTVRLDNPEARILPGMTARVEIVGQRYADRVFVPREAIVERDRRNVVFSFARSDSGSETGRAQWKYVTTGLESDRFVEIVPSEETDMLEEGEIVLVEGHTTLTHDARVRLRNGGELGGGS